MSKTFNLQLRKIQLEDGPIICAAFKAQGWEKPVAQYEHYFNLQESGERDIIIAELNGAFAGYLTIQWQSNYLTFQQKNIPEVVDFNVLRKFQRQGIGTALMDEAEMRIGKVAGFAGIGFGIHKDYGAAQILYIRRGYIPDGNGLIKDGQTLDYGDQMVIDHSLAICLVKKLN